ncbi:MAG: rhodanese-like domain-containing protein [Pseudomonadota bacterium]
MPDVRVHVDQLSPADAYAAMAEAPTARMVDVRTRAEWMFVGMPDLSALDRPLWTVEWQGFPASGPNPDFLEALADVAASDGGMPGHLLFICRSGARSMAAARAVAAAAEAGQLSGAAQTMRLSNVAEGFEGDLDANGHRGRANGWKVHGLPWRQN